MAKGYNGDVVVITATAAALGALSVVAAHQFGKIDHLVDPPGAIFASDEITESKAAHPLGIPDSVPGLASYATTLGLAIWARRSQRAQQVLAIKLLADSGAAGFNVVRQLVSFRKICSWCSAVAVCTAVSVVAGRGLVSETVPRVIGSARERVSDLA